MKKRDLFDVLSRRKTSLDCSSVNSAVEDLRKFFIKMYSYDIDWIRFHNNVYKGVDGNKYRDLDCIFLYERNPIFGPNVENSSTLIWETLQSVRGIQPGVLLPASKSSRPILAVRKGKVFFALDNKFLCVGSTCRFGKPSGIHDWVSDA